MFMFTREKENGKHCMRGMLFLGKHKKRDIGEKFRDNLLEWSLYFFDVLFYIFSNIEQNKQVNIYCHNEYHINIRRNDQNYLKLTCLTFNKDDSISL